MHAKKSGQISSQNYARYFFKTLKPNFLFLKPLNMYTIQSFHHGKKTVSKNSLEAQNDHDICDEWI